MSKLTLADILEIPMLIVSEGLGRAVDDEFDQVVAVEDDTIVRGQSVVCRRVHVVCN